MPLLNVQAANTILYCGRWSETVRFYRDVLALPVHQVRDWFIEFQITPDAFLSIADAARATVSSAAGQGLTLALHVRGLDELHRQLAHEGVRVGPIREVWGSRAFYFHDPEGHRLEAWA